MVRSDDDMYRGWEVARSVAGARIEGVEIVGFRDRDAVGLDMRVIPGPSVTVVIEFGDGLTVEGSNGRQRLSSLVAGLSPGPTTIRGSGVECIELRLTPLAARSVFGAALAEIDGAVVGLTDLCGPDAERLREQLAAAAGWPEAFALTHAFFERRCGSASVDPEVAVSWNRIVASRGRARIGELAAACGWSRNRLSARFAEQIGLTPKRAAMLVRFDHAVTGLAAGFGAADVASACGYTDQSHLHRDVTMFAGCTPGALIG